MRLLRSPARSLLLLACALAPACSDDEGTGLGDTSDTRVDDAPDTVDSGDSIDSGDTTDASDTTLPDTIAPDTSDTLGGDTRDTFTSDITSDATVTSDIVVTQICTPSTSICDSFDSKRICNADGLAYGDPIQCQPDESCRAGTCQVRCPNDPKFGNYVGCEFWATDLPNYPDPTLNPTPENLPWALVVSNPGQATVRVGFEMPPLFTYSPADDTVPPGTSRVFELPNINVQGTSLMPKGVHLLATGPVLTHMFNPWDNRFSNDASLLMPDPMLGTDYVILSWPTSPLDLVQIPGFPTPANQNGYFTVIAAYDNTNVTFKVTAPVRASGSIPKLNPGDTHTVTLKRGDVLSIQADPESLFGALDISGSTVSSNKPISVFGGHEEAVVGDPIPNGEGGTDSPCCADHLEEQMLPVPLLDTHYYAVKSPPRGTTTIEDDFWRIQAGADNITVNTNPPQAGANGVVLAKKGDFVQVKSNQSFEITATGKVQVAQYLSSRDTTEAFTGDASLLLMIPEARYRKDYAFAVPDRYSKLWATVVKPAAATVSVDGSAVPQNQFKALGSSGWELAYVAVNAGYHTASSTSRFGLFIYGYNNAVSFSYAGGLAGPGE